MTEPDPSIETRAQAEILARELAMQPLHSPEFRRQVAAVQALGEGAQRRAARASIALPTSDLPEWPQHLAQLRALLGQLQPKQPSLWARLRGHPPQPPTLALYTESVAGAEPLLARLYRAGDDLRRQEVMLAAEIRRLEGSQGELAGALALADELERVLRASLPDLEARQPLHAAAVREEVLFVVASRRTDLSTALAVAAQGRLAMDAARQQAAELRTRLEYTAAETVTALKLARQAVNAASLREQAATAGTKLAEAERDLAAAATPEDLSKALARALAALDDLQRAETEAREQLR